MLKNIYILKSTVNGRIEKTIYVKYPVKLIINYCIDHLCLSKFTDGLLLLITI